jgi:hypothetical protein
MSFLSPGEPLPRLPATYLSYKGREEYLTGIPMR